MSEEESTLISSAEPISELVQSVRLARLEQLRGPGAPCELMLVHEDAVLGRSDDADITIASQTLSRRHLRFVKNEAGVRVEDLDSSNGMYLNGTRAHSADLFEGDTIQIGDVVLIFHEGQ